MYTWVCRWMGGKFLFTQREEGDVKVLAMLVVVEEEVCLSAGRKGGGHVLFARRPKGHLMTQT